MSDAVQQLGCFVLQAHAWWGLKKIAALGQAGTSAVCADEVMLFRYSAPTFNGHRIHYDINYATSTEGHSGLVVHGPPIATLLLDLLRCQMPDARVTGYCFKAMRPGFHIAPFQVWASRRTVARPSVCGQGERRWHAGHGNHGQTFFRLSHPGLAQSEAAIRQTKGQEGGHQQQDPGCAKRYPMGAVNFITPAAQPGAEHRPDLVTEIGPSVHDADQADAVDIRENGR